MSEHLGNPKEELLKKMEKAYEMCHYLILNIGIEDYPEKEQIKVPVANIPKKMEYIKKTYTKDLVHKDNSKVKILSMF